MNVVELGDKTREVDAILYNLTAEYLEDGMDAEAKGQFERWFDLKMIDVFNKSLKAKKEIYEEG